MGGAATASWIAARKNTSAKAVFQQQTELSPKLYLPSENVCFLWNILTFICKIQDTRSETLPAEKYLFCSITRSPSGTYWIYNSPSHLHLQTRLPRQSTCLLVQVVTNPQRTKDLSCSFITSESSSSAGQQHSCSLPVLLFLVYFIYLINLFYCI